MKQHRYTAPALLLIALLLASCSDSEDDNPAPNDAEWSLGTYDFESLAPTVFRFTEVNGGSDLQLQLTQNALWFQDDQAGLLFTELTGDFAIMATVRAQRLSDASQAPDCDVCLGGLMARNPDDSNGENYVHLVVGRNPDGLGVETKTTVDGQSTFTPYDENMSAAELRMERVGSSFRLYRRDVGSTRTFVQVETYERPDLPQTLQVGFNIYTSLTGSTVADLQVIVEDITIE